jgi:translation initiation factor 4G
MSWAPKHFVLGKALLYWTHDRLETRMPTLDDDAIDFPQAYPAMAVLMRAAGLDTEEIDSLIEKVQIEGTPRVTPKMKLDKALAALDESG